MNDIPIELLRARLHATDANGGYPYLSSVLWALAFKPFPGLAKVALGPIGVDNNWNLLFDPEVVLQWSQPQLMVVLVHESMHLLREHAPRCSSRDKMTWNMAGDMEINQHIPGMENIPGILFPKTFNFPENLLAEEYYDLLQKGKQPQATGYKQCGCGDGAHTPEDGKSAGDDEDPPRLNDADKALIRTQVARDLLAAPPGTVPAGLQRWAMQHLKPQVPWRVLLRRFARRVMHQASGRTDYTYQRPSRRRIARVILPAMRGEKPHMLLGAVIDTSGSMGGTQISQALSEVEHVARELGAETKVYFCESEVAATTKVDRKLREKARGGGGTDMRVGIAAACGDDPKPDLVVVLTDGYTPWPTVAPKVPLVSVVIDGSEEGMPTWMERIILSTRERA